MALFKKPEIKTATVENVKTKNEVTVVFGDKEYVGCAYCSENDMPYYDELFGYNLAKKRAYAKYFRDQLKIKKIEFKALQSAKKSMIDNTPILDKKVEIHNIEIQISNIYKDIDAYIKQREKMNAFIKDKKSGKVKVVKKRELGNMIYNRDKRFEDLPIGLVIKPLEDFFAACKGYGVNPFDRRSRVRDINDIFEDLKTSWEKWKKEHSGKDDE